MPSEVHASFSIVPLLGLSRLWDHWEGGRREEGRGGGKRWREKGRGEKEGRKEVERKGRGEKEGRGGKGGQERREDWREQKGREERGEVVCTVVMVT